jgi:hypothetical protein
MKLLADIIEIATGDSPGLPVLLRKCLVLSYVLKNEKLKDWVDKELNGYCDNDELPDYRKLVCISKGFFVGPFQTQIHDQPLPLVVMKPEHRHIATTADLRQPIVAYDGILGGKDEKDSSFRSEWPPDVTTYYQAKFIQGYALNRAWREIPAGSLLSLVDTVRNRVLRFALDLQEDLGSVGDDLAALPTEKVDNSIVTYIYGGTNVIAGTVRDFTQIGTVNVQAGDLDGLIARLKSIGVGEADVPALRDALTADAAETEGPPRTIGQRTVAWVKNTAVNLGKAGADVAVDTLKTEGTKWIMQYLGLL